MPSFMPVYALRALALLAPALCGCADASGVQFAPPCPQVGILKDGADVTQFSGKGTDLTDMVMDGRITGVQGECALDDATHLRTSVQVTMDVARGPANPTRRGSLVYFVSVQKGRVILDKREISLPIAFQENSDRVQLSTGKVDLVLPVDEKTSGAAYRIELSYQLTPQELAFNRRRGPR